MQLNQIRRQVVRATAMMAVASASASAASPPLTVDRLGGTSNNPGVYITSPGEMSFPGSFGASELNIGGLAPAPVGPIVGVLAPSDTPLNGRTFLGSFDVGVSNFQFHSTQYDDPDNWDNPRRVYQGPDDLQPIAIPFAPLSNNLVFTPPGVPAMASTVTFSNGTMFVDVVRMLAGTRDASPGRDYTMALSGVQGYLQSCVLNDDVDPGQSVSRVGGTSRLTLDATTMLSVNMDVVAGKTGTGVLTVNGGQLSAGNVKLGSGPGAAGVLNLLSGGRLAVSQVTTLGAVAASDGSMTIDSTAFPVPTTRDLYVGDAGVGHLTLRNGGQLTVTGNAILANAPGSSAPDSIVQDPASTLSIAGNLTIGGAGSASLTLSNGGTLRVDGPKILLGAVVGGEGTLTLQGAATQLTFAGQLSIGGIGKGTLTLQQGSKFFTSQPLVLGDTPTGDGTLRVGQDAAFGAARLDIGRFGKGLIQLTGNGALYSGVSTVGAAPSLEPAAVDMFDASTWSAGSLVVGGANAGTVTVHDASKLTLSSGALVVGGGQVGKLTIDGPGAGLILTSAGASIGAAASGTLEVINGAVVNPIGFVTLGDSKNASGTIRVAGKSAAGAPSSLSLILLNVGNQGSGVVEVDGGAQLHLQAANIGGSSGGSGRVTLTNDSTLNVDQPLNVGNFGTGRLEIQSRSQVTAPSLLISGNDAKVIIDSERIVGAAGTPLPSLNTGDLQIANHGLLDVTGGGFVSTTGLEIGSPVGPATARVHAGSSIQWTGSLATLNGGSLEIFDGGTVVSTATTPQVVRFDSMGAASVSGVGSKLDTGFGSLLMLNGSLAVTQGASVETRDLFLNGTLSVTDPGSLLRSKLASSVEHAQIFDGGALTVTGATADFQELLRVYRGGAVTVSGATAVLGAHSGDSVTDMDVLTGSVTVNGGLLDAPDIVLHSTSKITSQLILDGADARMQGTSLRVGVSASGAVETGGTASADIRNGATATVTATTIGGGGTVTVGSGSKLTGTVSILSGGRLTGAGRVVGNVTNSAGTVAPGNSPGTLTVQGNYVQAALAVMDLQIDGTAAGQYDQLIVTGSTDLRGQVLLDFLDGYAPKAGDTFDILSTGSVTNYSPTYVVQGLAPGWQFTVTPHGGTYTLTSLSNAVATPEPQTLGIWMALASYALHGRSRRRPASRGRSSRPEPQST